MLTGTVLRSGGRVRIDAQLVDPATRAVHWANSYERDAQNVLALEAAVAEAIARRDPGEHHGGGPERACASGHPAKPAALDAYLQGRYFWNRRTEEGAQAGGSSISSRPLPPTRATPRLTAAWRDAYSLLGSIGTDGMAPNEAMPLAKAAALKAVELDPDLADAHVSLAYVKLSYDWDLPAAASGVLPRAGAQPQFRHGTALVQPLLHGRRRPAQGHRRRCARPCAWSRCRPASISASAGATITRGSTTRPSSGFVP